MKIVLSPFHVKSFQDYAQRLGLSNEELFTHLLHKFNRSDLLDGVDTESDDQVLEAYARHAEEAVVGAVEEAIGILRKGLEISSGLSLEAWVQPEAVGHLLKKAPHQLDDIELKVLFSYGRATVVSQASFGPESLSFYYDLQLIEALKVINLYIYFFTMEADSDPIGFRSSSEIRELVNRYPRSRWWATSYLVGQTEALDLEFEPTRGAIIDAERNVSVAFKFLLFHEIAHHLLRLDSDFSRLDVTTSETVCDEFAASILGLGLRNGWVDLVEAGMGVTSLFFLQHLKSIYTRGDVEISAEYPEVPERLATIPRLWGQLEPSVLRFPFKSMWDVADMAFRDFASLCRSLNLGIADQPMSIFGGKYFSANIANKRLTIFPSNLTPEQFLDKAQRQNASYPILGEDS